MIQDKIAETSDRTGLAVHLASRSSEGPPETMCQSFARWAAEGTIDDELATRLRKTVGFRSTAAHNYSVIDWNITHAIATEHLADFETFARIAATRIK